MTRHVALLAALLWLVTPGVARADAAGPTDYRTEITAVTPATDAISVSVEGGDAFLRIAVDPGHEVVILGYDDEPYLRIDENGVVDRNRRSYATYYNEERYGSSNIPDLVDNDAPPDWEEVGGGGTWAWHDHRAHWMGSDPPIGLEPGGFLPPEIVPIMVDGTPVSIEVRIGLVGDPSLAPVVFGALIGLGLAMLGIALGPASTASAMLLFGVGALVVGGGQYASLPAETGRLVTWWLLPAIAVASIVVAIGDVRSVTLHTARAHCARCCPSARVGVHPPRRTHRRRATDGSAVRLRPLRHRSDAARFGRRARRNPASTLRAGDLTPLSPPVRRHRSDAARFDRPVTQRPRFEPAT